MGNDLVNNKIDIIYILTLQKNPIINIISNYAKCRFISPKIDAKAIKLKIWIKNRYKFRPFYLF